jgi:hypothetical protein
MLQEGNNIRRLCKKGCRKCDWLSIKTDVQLHIVKKLQQPGQQGTALGDATGTSWHLP